MKRRAFRPDSLGAISLESRNLLSTVVASRVVMIRALSRGDYTQSVIPDAGSTTRLKGRVMLAGERGNLNSTIHGIGLIASGNAVGSATVGTREDHVDLSLVGETQVGSGAGLLPRRFDVTITGGTGKYDHATGTGKAILGLRPIGTTGRFRILIRLNRDRSSL